MQVFVGVGRITRDREAKRTIKQSDNMRLLLGAKSKNEKANAPKQLTFFRKKLVLGSLQCATKFLGNSSYVSIGHSMPKNKQTIKLGFVGNWNPAGDRKLPYFSHSLNFPMPLYPNVP